MAIEVQTVEPEPDHEIAAATVRTEDVTGTERRYNISLGHDGLMLGIRTDNYDPDEDRWPEGPTDTALEAAAARFRELGYHVNW